MIKGKQQKDIVQLHSGVISLPTVGYLSRYVLRPSENYLLDIAWRSVTFQKISTEQNLCAYGSP